MPPVSIAAAEVWACFYFSANSTEKSPFDDIEAVENWPRLWKRPYVTFELQHIYGSEVSISKLKRGETGYQGLLLR